MSAEPRVFLVRRRKVTHARRGGSWKLALADFMTAMMALFLVLWLLSSSSKSELEGVAEYFRTPLLVALTGGDRPTSSISVIPGGGPDPLHDDGERSRVDLRQASRPADVQRNFLLLRSRLEAITMQDPELRELRNQMRVYLVPEGLLVQLFDSERRPMFQRGSNKVEPYMRRLLHAIAPVLNELPNKISISGHTDNLPYPGTNPDYSNWELSTDRANASRRELVAGGLDATKLVRVVGMSDQVPVPDTNPRDPVNRRIELMMLDESAAATLHIPRAAEPVPDMPAAEPPQADYQSAVESAEQNAVHLDRA